MVNHGRQCFVKWPLMVFDHGLRTMADHGVHHSQPWYEWLWSTMVWMTMVKNHQVPFNKTWSTMSLKPWTTMVIHGRPCSVVRDLPWYRTMVKNHQVPFNKTWSTMSLILWTTMVIYGRPCSVNCGLPWYRTMVKSIKNHQVPFNKTWSTMPLKQWTTMVIHGRPCSVAKVNHVLTTVNYHGYSW